MLPIKLTFEGLYSYQNRQVIDFADLTSAGLFGILGNVGSGKSSILEAITYALYGETERLNARDKRSYNMMNLKSDRAYIEFDFLNYQNRTFRATRELRRNSKRFEDIRVNTVQFYELIDDMPIPLEHSNAEEIIGLSYANFKRTIIIPQGQFKEFLELGAKERTQMMMEIFQLHKYDLQDKVSELTKNNNEALNLMKGRLQNYDDATKENLQLQKDIFAQAVMHLNNTEKEHKAVSEKYQRLKYLMEDYITVKDKKLKFAKMSSNLMHYENLLAEVDNYERICRLFEQLLIDWDKKKKEVLSKSAEVEKAEINHRQIQISLENKRNELAKLIPYFNVLEQKKIEENDLTCILQIITLTEEINAQKERHKKGEQVLANSQNEEIKLKNEIQQLEASVGENKTRKMDSQLLVEIEKWYTTQYFLKNEGETISKKLEMCREEGETILTGLKQEGLDIQTYEQYFLRRNDALTAAQKEIEQRRSEAELQQKLAVYSSQLKEGKACPLCGSHEHPSIAHQKDMAEEVAALTQAYGLLEKDKEMLHQQRVAADRMVNKYHQQQQLFKTIVAEKKDIEQKLSLQLDAFVWKEFDPHDARFFDEKKQQSLQIEKQIAAAEKQMVQLRQKLEALQYDLKRYVTALENIRLEENRKITQISVQKSLIKTLSVSDFQNRMVSEIKMILKELSEKNKYVEKTFISLENEINELKPQAATHASVLGALQHRMSELLEEEKELNISIQQKMAHENIADIEAITSIISKRINVIAARNEINDFKLQFGILKNEVESLELKLKNESFEESLFEQQKILFQTSEKRMREASEMVVTLDADIKRLMKKLTEKQELEKELLKIEKRAENLKVMFSLFKGSGFVQYVSSIYLTQLCNHANVRFHRMTRNQLSLTVNSDNEFEIIDYLNEGRSRSVKTLSGGQSFQLSLSLALALAESVQANAKANKNFFFIDEGFGTQDLESVNIVFETLINLNKENKIVGIISHLEELKERIPLTLTVEKDEETGSWVKMNK